VTKDINELTTRIKRYLAERSEATGLSENIHTMNGVGIYEEDLSLAVLLISDLSKDIERLTEIEAAVNEYLNDDNFGTHEYVDSTRKWTRVERMQKAVKGK